jgi:CoA:oxalate CoA-transferase
MKPAAPLAGVTVIDLSELLPGPFVTQSMVDLGAEVIKVERPPHGDNARRIGPGTFESVNRGKKSILADLKQEEDRARIRALIVQADVLIEGYRPGVMARLGLNYESLKADAPQLIYASLTGFGQQGPDAMLPGHDINYLGAAGVLSVSGEDDGPPTQTLGLPVADLAGAMACLSAILAALYQRTHSGSGQYLDVAIVDSVLHWMTPRLGQFAHAEVLDGASQRRYLRNKPAYGIFRCADGRHITIGALEDHFWAGLNSELKLFVDDADACKLFSQRAARCNEINKRLQAVLDTIGSEEAVARLRQANLPVFPVLETEEATRYARQRERHPVIDTAHGPRVRFPVRMAGTDDAITDPCVLGAHRLAQDKGKRPGE